jgi:hypothetical protein
MAIFVISFAKYPKHLLLSWVYYDVRKEREVLLNHMRGKRKKTNIQVILF